MRLSKRQLAEKLRCSERAITTWQQNGLPVLERGRRGQPNVYDLGAVLAWIKETGAGLMRNSFRLAPIDIDSLELELGRENPSAKRAAEEVFDYLAEHGVVPLAARFYAENGGNIRAAIVTTIDAFDVLWNVLVDRFGEDDFAPESEKFLPGLYDDQEPESRRFVEQVFQAAALQRSKSTPELALGPPAQTSVLAGPGPDRGEDLGGDGPAGA